MGRAYSQHLRDRVIDAVETEGLSCRAEAAWPHPVGRARLLRSRARQAEANCQAITVSGQPGYELQPLIHDVTLLPRHLCSPRNGPKVSPMSPEWCVTHLSGRAHFSPCFHRAFCLFLSHRVQPPP